MIYKTNDPFYCPHCRLSNRQDEVNSLKDTISSISTELSQIKAELANLKADPKKVMDHTYANAVVSMENQSINENTKPPATSTSQLKAAVSQPHVAMSPQQTATILRESKDRKFILIICGIGD